MASTERGCWGPLIKVIWFFIFSAFGGAAAVWWWITPHGFPLGHPRFWANIGIPLAILCVSLFGISALFLPGTKLLKSLALFVLSLVACGAIYAFLLYPISFGPSNGGRFIALLVAVAGGLSVLLLLVIWLLLAYRSQSFPYGLSVGAILFGAGIGAGFVQTQRGLPPATQPLNVTLPAELSNLSLPNFLDVTSMSLGPVTTVWPDQASLVTRCGDLELYIAPLLTFQSRSPDRFWTLFAPPEARARPFRGLDGFASFDDQIHLSYLDNDRSWLTIQDIGNQSLEMTAYSRVATPVYSHLNTYVEIVILNGGQLQIAFEAAKDIPIEFKQFVYPIGEPARLAYLDQNDQLRVVEATSAEKGPFNTLAEGGLAQADPLEFTLYNNGVPQCLLVFDDWAAQASTQLSPTAGWGVPENGIEFRLDSSGDSNGLIFMTLANTSTGRGFDSVGHEAGVYRNRMRIVSLNLIDSVEKID